jgi:NADH-quinone oxidoreductase subunit E
MLRGAQALAKVCHQRIGEQFHVTADGSFSWVEVECLGACVNAPMAQINYDFYEDLTAASFNRILDDLAAGKDVRPGPQVDRQFSAPIGGPTTLTDPALYAAAPGGAGGGTHTHGGPPLQDAAAKRPGEAANIRDAAVPKAPVGDASTQQQSGTRRE